MKNSSSSASAFLIKLSTNGQEILFSTFLGGSSRDWVYGIEITSTNEIVLTGHVNSIDFPTLNPIQNTHGGMDDAFLMIISQDVDEILYSTYIGGSEWEMGFRVNFNSQDHLILTGFSGSDNLFTHETIVSDLQGGDDFFIVEFLIKRFVIETSLGTSSISSHGQVNTEETYVFDLYVKLMSGFTIIVYLLSGKLSIRSFIQNGN